MNYKVGDEVVCIDAMPVNAPMQSQIKAGEKYTVAVVNATCVAMKELTCPPGLTACTDCGCTKSDLWHYDSWRFIKLDKLTESSTEQLTEKVWPWAA